MFRRSTGLLPALLTLSLLAAPLGSLGGVAEPAGTAVPPGVAHGLPAMDGAADGDGLPAPAPMLQQQDQNGTEPAQPGPNVGAERARPTREISFFGHVFGMGLVPSGPDENNEFGPDGPQPANTIFPEGDSNLGLGFFDWCTEHVNLAGLPPTPQSDTGCDENPRNKLALFLTAGPVQIHTRPEFTYSKMHNEHGRTKDVVLDTSADVTASVWMSLDLHSWPTGQNPDGTACVVDLPRDVGCPIPYWGWDPAYWPGHVIEASLYMVELGEYGQGASEPPPIAESLAAGTLIAQGSTGPTDITNGLPGSPNVHEFVVNLGPPQVELIPKTMDIIMVFSWYSIIGGQKVGAHSWRLWSGELFPTKFTLPVKNPLDVEFVIPQFVHDKLLLHGVISSAWGSYDVDLKSATVTVLNDRNQAVPLQTVSRVGDFQVAHGAHFKPVNLTWIWDYRADALPPGTYKVIIEACNAQRSACESTEGGFTIGPNGQPLDIRVGRSGQRTVSEGQLRDVTGGLQTQSVGSGPQAGGEGSSAADGQDAASLAQGPRVVPGAEAALLALAAAGAALVTRRRWMR